MTIIQIIDTFTFYGFDVIALAAIASAVTQVLKITVFRHAQKKLVTFLPFVCGIALYAIYACIRNLSFAYLAKEYTAIIEHGISVGAVATMYYVLYEQFVREKSGLTATEEVIKTLIEGYVPTENLDRAAKAVAEAIERDVTGNGAIRAQEILTEYADCAITERDIQLLSRLIIETLAHLSTK